MANRDLELRIIAKNLASPALKQVEENIKGLSSHVKTVGGAFSSVFSGVGSTLKGTIDSLFSLKSALLGFIGIAGVGSLVKGFVGINAEFEKIQVTMDVLTKGKGEEFFNKFNNWAMNMPISIAEVSKAFVTMKAYGLEPTTKMMENLVNVASLLPESGRAMTGIARAMGQIQAKGRLEGQELRQLAEWAVPGYEAVYTKIFEKISKKTGIAKEKLKFTMIDAATATKALWETIEEHFGGAAESISKTWSGLWIRMQNHFKEFIREIGAGGAMSPLKDQLENIVNWLSEAFKSGKMQAWGDALGKVLGNAVEAIGVTIRGLFSPGGAGDIGGAAKSTVKVAIDSFYTFLKFIAYIPTAWSSVHSAIISALGTFTGSIKTIIAPVVAWYKFLASMPNIPFVNVLGKDFEKNKNFVLGLDEALGGFSDELADNKYQVDLNTAAWDKQYSEVSKNLAKLKTESIQVMNDINKNIKPRPTEEAAKTQYPDYGADVYIKDYDKEINAMNKALLEYDRMLSMIEKNNIKVQKTLMSPKELHAAYQKHIAENGTFWQKMGLGFEKFKEKMKKRQIKELADYFEDFFNSLQSGFSNAFQGILDGSLTFSEGMQGVLKSIETAFFQTISNMLAQWIVNQCIMAAEAIFMEKVVTVATAEGEAERLAIQEVGAIKGIAISVAKGIKQITINAYEAASAVYGAFAWIPLVGPALGVAAVVGTLALILGMVSKISGFEKGTGLSGVRETGPANLHRGEIVLNRKESDAYRQGVSEGGGGASNNVSLSFNISALDGSDVERVVRKQIIPLIRQNIRDNGVGRTMIREAR